jgi:RNA polymerase-interacting CarD/CdnL/TRCF family regulator
MQSNKIPKEAQSEEKVILKKIPQEFLKTIEKFCLKTSERSKSISAIAKVILNLMREVNECTNKKMLTTKIEFLRRELFKLYNNFEQLMSAISFL